MLDIRGFTTLLLGHDYTSPRFESGRSVTVMSRRVDIWPQQFHKSFVREPTAPVFISMSTNSVLKDADELIARAQAIATVLGEKRDQLGISPDVEELLRVSIEATRFSINRYAAVLAGEKKGRLSAGYVAEAKARCNRNIQQL